jgi:hypothetical protein
MEMSFASPEKNSNVMKNLIRETEKRLGENYDPDRVKDLMEKIGGLEQEIDYKSTGQGIAMFVSDSDAKLVYLPFAPKETVSVGSSFQTRDLVFALNRNAKYYMLALSQDPTRLFSGLGSQLTEIKTDFFPSAYAGPSRTEALSQIHRQDTENEELEDIRIYLRRVDENVEQIVSKEKLPLFIAGEAEYISFLKSQNKSARYLKGEIHENMAHLSFAQVGERIYPHVHEYLQAEKEKQLHNLQEMVGYGRYAGGIQDVWKAAKLGQVMTLLVEQNYTCPAHVKVDDPLTLELNTPQYRVTNWHDDIVDDVMELVASMDGEVLFVEDGELEKHGNIAAILRYSLNE